MPKNFAKALSVIACHPGIGVPTRKLAHEILITLPADFTDEKLIERLEELDRQEAELIESGAIVIDG